MRFSQLVADTIQGNEEIVIVTDRGSVVMLNELEWESVKELVKLFRDKKSLAALLSGQHQRDLGLVLESRTAEQVFCDLQN